MRSECAKCRHWGRNDSHLHSGGEVSDGRIKRDRVGGERVGCAVTTPQIYRRTDRLTPHTHRQTDKATRNGRKIRSSWVSVRSPTAICMFVFSVEESKPFKHSNSHFLSFSRRHKKGKINRGICHHTRQQQKQQHQRHWGASHPQKSTDVPTQSTERQNFVLIYQHGEVRNDSHCSIP